jgi:hypothetical protein
MTLMLTRTVSIAANNSQQSIGLHAFIGPSRRRLGTRKHFWSQMVRLAACARRPARPRSSGASSTVPPARIAISPRPLDAGLRGREPLLVFAHDVIVNFKRQRHHDLDQPIIP